VAESFKKSDAPFHVIEAKESGLLKAAAQVCLSRQKCGSLYWMIQDPNSNYSTSAGTY